MKHILLACAIGLVGLPVMAGPGCHRNKTADTAQISCAEGQVWDAQLASCVTLES